MTMKIQQNIITLALAIRYPADSSDPDNYHWLFWIPTTADISDGLCIHASNQTGGFSFETKPWKADGSKNLAALIQIGSLGEHSIHDVIGILRNIPMQSPAGSLDEPVRFSCRIWIREAVRVLTRVGIINCSDVDSLEEECEAHADANRRAVELGKPGSLLSLFLVSQFSK